MFLNSFLHYGLIRTSIFRKVTFVAGLHADELEIPETPGHVPHRLRCDR
jgi:hypothetical protein